MPDPGAPDADRSQRRIAVWADEVTRRRRAWMAARRLANSFKAHYDAGVVRLNEVIAAETTPPPPPPSAPEGEGRDHA